jgi:uncharacterized protein (TIGR03118 family)
MRLPVFTIFAVALFTGIASGASIGYFQTNLTSDIPGLAPNTDPSLKNPWGMSFSATSPFWISDQATDLATLYNGAGVPQALVVTVPPAAGPTGQVFTGGQGFTGSNGAESFVFSTLGGTIDGWNAGTTAVSQFTATDGAVYTGLALMGTKLYAADTKNGKIDVFSNTFQKAAPVAGAFVDAGVPAGFTPYNIQTVNNKLYVEYAQRNQPGGFVAVFDANGNLLQHISDSHFNSPWGVTLAPSGFGQFANDLLVGNFNDGMINAFDPVSGSFIGTLSDSTGKPIVNSGLWALEFRSSASGFDSNTLFFSAGINAEKDGLFGELQTVPEPATVGFGAAGLLILAFARLRRRC